VGNSIWTKQLTSNYYNSFRWNYLIDEHGLNPETGFYALEVLEIVLSDELLLFVRQRYGIGSAAL
jgi:hypothetical protein